MKALKVLSLALAGVLVGSTLHVGDAEAARKRMSKPAASSQASGWARSTNGCSAERAIRI